jgi:hypothetical protein
MTTEVDDILLSLLNTQKVEQLDLEHMRSLAVEYPFSSLFQLLYTLKAKSSSHTPTDEAMGNITVHFPDNLWVVHLLRNNDLTMHPGIPALTDLENLSAVDHTETPETELISFDPYHTVDYFASQGIKLNHMEQGDALGIKLKSFTAWLKTMKKLQPQEKTFFSVDNLSSLENSSVAAHELATTEAMAEVYLKQGLIEKAIEVYTKLSLQNPANSHIFVNKIAELNKNSL